MTTSDIYAQTGMLKSTLRHRPINPTQTTRVATPRSSAHPSLVLNRFRPQQRQCAPYDDTLIDELTSQQQAPDTYGDDQVAPSTRAGYRPVASPMQYQPPRGSRWHPRNWHPLALFGLGMMTLLILWFFGLRLATWYTNTFSDPAYYTQTAHLDTTTVTDTQGNRSQIHAFIDAQGRLDLSIMPEDPSKSRIVIGSTLTSIDDPQHKAILIVTASGTSVTVTAQGPLLASGLVTYRQSAQWTVDISQQKQQ